MKTFKIHAIDATNTELVEKILDTLVQRGLISLQSEYSDTEYSEKATPATEEQVQEIIEEAELGPYYSEKQAKEILNL
jgi:hypothetical protein